MGALEIPESIQVGLRLFRTLDRSVVEQLFGALSEEPPRIGVNRLVDSVTAKLRTLPKEDLTKLVSAILGLHSGLRITKLSQEDFLQAVVDSEELAVPNEEKSAFKTRLKQCLELPSVAITSKVNDVRTDHEHTFRAARILTDLRPIFGYDNVESSVGKPAAAVISHMLKIEYMEGHELKEMFFALDVQDVADLRAVLRRADAKGIALKALADKAQIPYLEAE